MVLLVWQVDSSFSLSMLSSVHSHCLSIAFFSMCTGFTHIPYLLCVYACISTNAITHCLHSHKPCLAPLSYYHSLRQGKWREKERARENRSVGPFRCGHSLAHELTHRHTTNLRKAGSGSIASSQYRVLSAKT